MKIQFLGTAAAEGIPSVFCECEYCKLVKSLGESQFRTRSQVLIDDCLSIDFPPDAYCHSLKFGVNFSTLKYVLATHSHLDHFYAHDFVLRGYKYAHVDNPLLRIYGNDEVKKVFDECTARELKEVVKPHLSINVIKPYDVLGIDKYKIIALPAKHGKGEQALLFYIQSDGKSYLHFYDTATIGDDVFKFLKDSNAFVDLVCFDCTFLDGSGGDSARHMCLADNLLMRQKLLDFKLIDDNSKIVISHFSHNARPTSDKLKIVENTYGFICAYDGLTINL